MTLMCRSDETCGTADGGAVRSYVRTRFALLLWAGLCFAGLTVNNVLLLLDKAVYPDVDLSPWRAVVGLVSMLLLVVGLVTERGR